MGLVPLMAVLRALGATPALLVIALPLLAMLCYGLLRLVASSAVRRSRAKLVGVLESVAEVDAPPRDPRSAQSGRREWTCSGGTSPMTGSGERSGGMARNGVDRERDIARLSAVAALAMS